MSRVRALVALSQIMRKGCYVDVSFSHLRIHGWGQNLDAASIRLLSGALANDELPPHISINDTPLNSEYVSWIGEGVEASGTLSFLSLRNTNMDVDGARTLFGWIRGGGSLRILDLDDNGLGDLGALSLAENIHAMNLTRISLCNNGITSVGRRTLQKYDHVITFD